VRRRGTLAVLVVLAQALGTAHALGAFSGSGVAGHTLASATLQPVTNLSAVTSCGPLLSLSAKVDLTWLATLSTFATGYKVERWQGSTLQNTATITPRTTVTRTENGLATGTTYTWKVYSYFASWTSSVASVTATTPGLCL
jgi:hypothetical protein